MSSGVRYQFVYPWRRYRSRSTALWQLMFAVLVVAASGSVSAANGPVIPQGKGSQCVADTDLMRREHMNLLDHQRDDTVISGIRDQPFSLAECVACHAQTDAANRPVRIDEKGQFCESCHSYAAVKIDCFTCHAATPPDDKTAMLPGAGHHPVQSTSLVVPVFPRSLLPVRGPTRPGVDSNALFAEEVAAYLDESNGGETNGRVRGDR